MKIKGTAVRILPKYIQKFYPSFYDLWLEQLPDSSREIFSKQIYPTEWFPLYESAVLPIEILAQVLSLKPQEVALKVGRYSGEDALKGVYKAFVTISSVSFLLKRAASIVGIYYDPVEIHVQRTGEKQVKLDFGYVNPNETLIFYRIQGWVEQLVLMTQRAEPNIILDLEQNAQGLIIAKFTIQW